MALKKVIIILCGTLALTFVSLRFFNKKDLSINLYYTLNYKGDDWQKNRTGFLWALSYLGAELPKGSFDKSIHWIDSSTFKLSFETLGFNDNAIEALEIITDSIKQSNQYQRNNSIDLAQFVVLTIGSSWHYYAVTGAPQNYETYLKEHKVNNEKIFPLTHSTVAKHNRLIKFMASDSVLQSVFIAEEGEGDLETNTFATQFYEVMDVMPNGQLRFAIYNKAGELTDASPKHLGQAGKPAKCLWCHEIVMQPLFVATDTLVGKMSPAEFQHVIEQQNGLLNNYRKRLRSDIDFNQTQDHTLMELLYISYMEPSLNKLSKEWNMDPNALKKVLIQQTSHHHSEFDFLNEQYYRKDLESHVPHNLIKTCNDVREPSEFEPNYISKRKK